MIRPFRKAAAIFLVRRYGNAAGWRCTYREIAQATGVEISIVSQICRQRGYVLRKDAPLPPDMPLPVDRHFAAITRRQRLIDAF